VELVTEYLAGTASSSLMEPSGVSSLSAWLTPRGVRFLSAQKAIIRGRNLLVVLIGTSRYSEGEIRATLDIK
jgi:hypothetical protein